MTENYEKSSSILMPYIWKKTNVAKSERQKFVHYTSAETAISIIRNRKVWMRRTSMMNDYSEVEHGLNCLTLAYNDSELGKEFVAALDSTHEGLSKEVEALFNKWRNFLALDSYMICISEHLEHEDNIGRLSMWRAYGGKNSVALVLNPEAMMNNTDVIKAYRVPVSYAYDVRFKDLFRDITKGIKDNVDLFRTLDRERLRELICLSFAFQALATKHPGFREEREWRIVAIPKILGDGFLEKSVETICGAPQPVYKIPLKNSIEEGISSIELNELIDKIIVGPSEFGYPIRDAFVSELENAGVENAAKRIVVSNIPLR